jgi:hypothetical protein
MDFQFSTSLVANICQRNEYFWRPKSVNIPSSLKEIVFLVSCLVVTGRKSTHCFGVVAKGMQIAQMILTSSNLE